ncbi:MAG: PH domain-containing protein [Candidatus Accumulibacter sp.]|jgi:hypothetical protein|nr:PH domain-containing protein [Accumulibacter sp.]
MSFDFKNASPEELKKEYERIAKETGDDQFFTKKELNHLPEILLQGEQVLAFSSGFMNGNTWLVALTDRRIIFLDKGLIFGLTQETVDLDKINTVSGETGLILGKIAIQDGAIQRIIDNVPKRSVLPFTNRVRDAIEARKNKQHAPAVPQDDVVSKLERLAALPEKGILSPEEFKEQKVKILSGA